MGNALGDEFEDQGALAGMRGTTPLTDLAADFKDRLKRSTRTSKDFNYAGETYDAVVLIALAAQMAGTNDATLRALRQRRSPSAATSAPTSPPAWRSSAPAATSTTTVSSGPLAFTDAGEPAQASFGLLQFGDDNKIDDSKTEFVIAGDEANAATTRARPGRHQRATGGPLTIGTLLPQTGSLAFLGPPEVAGVELAIQEINAAGGVLGKPVELVEGDSGDASTDTATQTVDRLLQRTSTPSSVRRPPASA